MSAILDDPTYLPHRLDLVRGELLFLPCDPAKIAHAAFIDGRTDIATGPLVAIPLHALPFHPPVEAPENRFLFHIGFCGSTLLSRLIEAPGRVRILREPNILADLANYCATLNRAAPEYHAFEALLQQIVVLLHRPWSPGETIVVKPSNWANIWLPSLAPRAERTRAVFLSIARPTFLRAVFRGGGDRIAFAARAAVHLSSRGEQSAKQVAAALARPGDDLDRLAALVVVLHHIQMQAFADIIRDARWDESQHLRWDQQCDDPATQARRARRALCVDIPEAVLATNIARWAGHNAKAPDLAYSPTLQAEADRRADNAQGDRIASALEWADSAIGLDRA